MTDENEPAVAEVDWAAIDRMDSVVRLLDDGYELPVVGVSVGLDPLLGLVPVVGDSITAVVGLYIVLESARLGVSRFVLARMCLNIAIDWAVGSVPVFGDLLDVVFRSHRRNFDLALADLGVSGTPGE